MRRASRRMRIGVLMLAILVVGLGCAGFLDEKRGRHFRGLAEHHLGEMAAMASVSRSNLRTADMFDHKIPPDSTFAFLMPVNDTRSLRETAAEYSRRADYHASLERKYRWASTLPWTSVEPDPPSP